MTKVLIVEDDNTIAFGVKYALEQEGFIVSIAKNIDEGRRYVKDDLFHIILLDVMLPDGTGYELCKFIRKFSEIPIIFLTACDEEVNIVMGLDIGGDDYMTKPFRIRELLSRINAVLRRKIVYKQEDNKILHLGNISVHTLEARVYKDNKEVFLTSIEYKLLLILIQNKGLVLSRSQILEKLWDVSYDLINDNTLTVYIKRLREKIEDNPSNPKLIVTVRGIGYKWLGSDN